MLQSTDRQFQFDESRQVPEFIPINANVHFKCAFDVAALTVSQPMTHIRQKLRSWCLRKIGDNDQTLHRAWFYIGNNPKVEPAYYVVNGHQIRTVIAPSADPDEPTCWALEIIHADSEERSRRWSAEVTIRQLEDGIIRFTTVVKHWMIPYFIGEYPEPPSPSSPAYVRSMIDDIRLKCTRGDAQLTSHPTTVSVENCRQIFEQLESDSRQVPFVFIACDASGQRMPANSSRIARTLVGNANVFVLSTEGAVEEMNYYLGDEFRCAAGCIRVYIPQLNRANPDNARLHRYLSGHIIGEQGEDGLIRILTNGLSRNGATFKLGDLTSFADIFSERRKYVIKKLAAEHQDSSQEAKMVWEENEKLAQDAGTWEATAIQYEAENKRLREENSSFRFRIEEAERVRQRIGDLESQLQGLSGFEELPTNLADILNCMARLFPNRLIISDEARGSASEYSDEHGGYWQKAEQLAVGWKMVFDATTNLYDLIFVNVSNRLEEDFNTSSKFQLAMSEGKQTKKDSQLMKLRQLSHNGRMYDITPHIKYGNKSPKLLRLHFAIDRESGVLVVGHFGDHLENYSSRNH